MEKTIVGRDFNNLLGERVTDIVSKFVSNKADYERFFEFCEGMKDVALDKKALKNVYNLIDGANYHLNNKIVTWASGITTGTCSLKFRVTENNAGTLSKRAVIVHTRLPAYSQAWVSKFNKKTNIVNLKRVGNSKTKVFKVEVGEISIWAEFQLSEQSFRNPDEAEERAALIWEMSENRYIDKGNAGK